MNSSNFSDLSGFLVFPFRDADWMRKLGIAALVGLTVPFIPILPLLALAGYAARTARRVLESTDDRTLSLPDWDDLEGLLVDGLRMTGALLTLVLPLTLGLMILFMVVLAPVVAIAPEQQAGSLGVLLMVFFSAFVTVTAIATSLALSVMMPAAITHVIARRSYAAVFDVKGWVQIWWANPGGFLLSVLLVWAVSLVLSLALGVISATVVLLCLAPFLTGALTAYLALLQASLGGREYRIGRERVWQKPGAAAAQQAAVAAEAEAVPAVEAAAAVEAEAEETVARVAEEAIQPAETVDAAAPIDEPEEPALPAAPEAAEPAEMPGDAGATVIIEPPAASPEAPEEGEEKA